MNSLFHSLKLLGVYKNHDLQMLHFNFQDNKIDLYLEYNKY